MRTIVVRLQPALALTLAFFVCLFAVLILRSALLPVTRMIPTNRSTPSGLGAFFSRTGTLGPHKG